MNGISARTPLGARVTFSIFVLFYLAATVGSVWVALANPDGSFSRPVEAAIGGGLFWGAWLALSLWMLGAASAVYEADEQELRRKGWWGVSSIRWDEIGRYRLRTWAGNCTYILYDRQGKRRTAVDFRFLGRNGEPLLDLLMQKLAEALPDQQHQRPVVPTSLFGGQRRALPTDPGLRAKERLKRVWGASLVVVMGGGITLAGGYMGGKEAWRHAQLVRGGEVTEGVVLHRQEVPDTDTVVYRFESERIPEVVGRDRVSWQTYRRLRVGDRVAVRYLRDSPRANELTTSLRGRRAALWLVYAVLGLAGVAYYWGRRRRLLEELRADRLDAGAGPPADPVR